jgi:DNA (cytosine-5)-methyltransferase 1
MLPLSYKQAKIFSFVSKYIDKNGISPTINEIGEEFGLRSTSTVHQHLVALIKKGHLTKDEYSVRGLKINKEQTGVEIPIIGIIAAGSPIEAVENDFETVSVGNEFAKNKIDFYALKVAGDSMIEEGIFDGDTVVIKKQSSAENGQTVVAIIDDNEATLKKLYREKSSFRLQSANQKTAPLFRDEVEVRGVVVKVIRDIAGDSKIENMTTVGHRTIDLFAGIGGIRLGFETAGFETVFANDSEEKCKDTYDLNFNTSKLIVEDIREIEIDDLPEFDFLLGGFPCQAFSVAGYRKGFDDEKGRGNLFFDIAKIIEARKPKGFLLENVKNLYSHDGGRTFEIIMKTLSKLGYHVHAKVLNTMEYGNIPQNRERIYIVGFKNKKHYEKFEYPKPVKLAVKVTDLLEDNVTEKYYYNGKPLYKRLENDIKEEGRIYQWRRQYVRENKSGVCPTLTANMGTGGHNVPIIKDKKGIRKLTPLECARIQGFPESYKLPPIADSALYKQIGNSVSVPVISAMAKKIQEAVS